MISKKHLEDYCLPYSGHLRCRFLAEDEHDWTKFYCLKRSKKRTEIDSEVVELLIDMKAKGLTPETQGIPLGDNCKGFILLRHLEQGYDKP